MKDLETLCCSITHIERVDFMSRPESNALPKCFNDDYFKNDLWDKTEPMWVGYVMKDVDEEFSAIICEDFLLCEKLMTEAEVNYIIKNPNLKRALKDKHKKKFRKYYVMTFGDVNVVYIKKEKEFNEQGCSLWGYDKENHAFELEHSWFSDNYKKKYTDFYNKVMNAMHFNIKYKLPVGDALRDNSCSDMPTTGPAVRYLQHDEAKCATYSLASALYNIGDIRMSQFISNLEPEIDDFVRQKTNRSRNTAFTYIVNAMNHNAVKGNPTGSLSKYECTYFEN